MLVVALVIVLFLVEGFFIVRFVTLARRFGVYFKRSYPEKARVWLSRWPLVIAPSIALWYLSFEERGDMPDDETLKDLQGKASRALFAVPLAMLVFLLLVTLCVVLIDVGLSA